MRHSAIEAMVERQYRSYNPDNIVVEFLYSEASGVTDLEDHYPSTKEVYKVTIYFDDGSIVKHLISIDVADI